MRGEICFTMNYCDIRLGWFDKLSIITAEKRLSGMKHGVAHEGDNSCCVDIETARLV